MANRGNFADDRERAAEAGRKGGQELSGKFEPGSERASEAGRKGGQELSGKFEPGSERASEAGRKGGQELSGKSEPGSSGPPRPAARAASASGRGRRGEPRTTSGGRWPIGARTRARRRSAAVGERQRLVDQLLAALDLAWRTHRRSAWRL